MKKMNLMLAAVAVIAVAIPATASASTGLTEQLNGSRVLTPIGTTLSYDSKNFKLSNTIYGTIACSDVKLLNRVAKNSAVEGVEGLGLGEQMGTSCPVGGNSAEFKEMKLSTVSSPAISPGKGIVNLSFTETLPGSLNCHFTGTNLPFTYVSESSSLSISEAALSISPASCVHATPRLSATFTLAKYAGQTAISIR